MPAFNFKASSSILSLLSLLVSVVFVCILAFMYPLCSDDYAYAFIHWSNVRVTSLYDILCSEYHHYLYQHGRIWAQALVQFFMMYDKCIFNVCVIACYLFSSILIARFTKVRLCVALSIIIPSFWVVVTMPGQTIFWLAGACNYIFTTCITLLFLTLLLSKRKWCLWFALPIAVLAGNSHEGTSCGLLAALLIYTVLDRKNKKSFLFYLNLLFFLFGVISIFLSPGTADRVAQTGGNTATDIIFVKQLITLAKGACHFCFELLDSPLEKILILFSLLLASVSNIIHIKANKRPHLLSFSIMCGAWINFLLPLAANATYNRAFYGAVSLALCSSYMVILPMLVEKKRLLVPIHITLLVANISTFIVAFNQVSRMRDLETYVISRLQKGESVICLPENLSNVNGRFVESYGNFNNYRENGNKSLYVGAPQEYSVLSRKAEIKVFEQCNFDNLSEERVHYLPQSKAVIVRLKGRHKSESVTFVPKQESTSISRLKAKFLGENQRRAQPFAAIAYKGSYYVIIPNPAKDITMEISYRNGEEETLHLNETK